MSFMQMSYTAGIMIIGIVLFRSLFLHRIPKRVMILLWGLVALRLIVPFSISSSFPGIGNLAAVSAQKMEIDTVSEIMISGVYEQHDPGMMVYTVGTKEADWGIVFMAVYFVGVAVMVFGSLYLYVRDSGLFRESLPMDREEKERLLGHAGAGEKEREYLKKINFRISDRTATPVTYGLLHPAIVFPKGIFFKEEKEVGFCVLHELIHLRNRDTFKKLAMHGILCIHWFNPFVWVMYFLFNRDIELLCDETAVQKCMAKRQDYALALLSLAEYRAMGFRTALGFGKNAVKERILAVMKAGKITISGRMAAVFAVVLALTAFLGGRLSAITWTGDVAEYVVTSEEPVVISWAYDDEKAYTADVISQEATATSAVAFSVSSKEEEAAAEVSEYDAMPESLEVSLKKLAAEYRGYGLQVQFDDDDYQLYFEGEPVYFFADNQNQSGEKFSGRVFARAAGNGNGNIGVATKRDESGVVIGLVALSEEESKDVARAWTGG